MSVQNTLIKVEAFEKSFDEKQIHKGLDFELYEGEVVSLLGASGTGKSVFLRSLIGLEVPDKGRIFYRGTDVTRFNERQWDEIRINIAYAFQGGALFDSFTVEENLLYPLEAHTNLSKKEKKIKIDRLLKRLGLEGTQKLLPSDLSGGMQKRAGLARAIILDPEIILYDEPTAGLDPFNTKNIQEIIIDLKKSGCSGILVTHDMPTAIECSERLSLLHEGKIKSSGKVKDLKKDPMVQSFLTGES